MYNGESALEYQHQLDEDPEPIPRQTEDEAYDRWLDQQEEE